MSSKPKGSRFAGQLSALAGRPAEEEQAAPVLIPKSDDLETFSSHMTKSRKRRLKMAATREDRKIYEIVGELVEAWLHKHHPDLK